jgi:hypothetical protein
MEMQIKTALRFHLTPVRITILRSTNNNKCWQGYGGKMSPHTLLVGMSINVAAIEISMRVPQRTKNKTAM